LLPFWFLEEANQINKGKEGVAMTNDSSRNEGNDRQKADRAKLLQALRELTAELIDLNALIDKIKAGQTSVVKNAGYIKKTRQDIQKLITEIDTLNTFRSDSIRHILNSWEQMTNSAILCHPDQDLEAQEQLHELTTLRELASDMILQSTMRTVPPRVNDWLKKARPGHYLPFHLLFEDEIPSQEARVKVLNAIAWAPETVHGGLVNPATGLIYSYEQDPNKRIRSFLTLVLFLVFCSALVFYSAFIQTWYSDWPIKEENAPQLLFFWIALLLGVMTHIGIANVKKIKNSGLPPVIAAGDWSMHLSARKGEILLKIFMALIAFFVLLFSLSEKDFKIYSSFLVGYSLDSFIEIFGTSLEQKSAGQLDVLKGQLGIKEK